ncbi:MFS transporter [Bifidobacterium choloepi]|uniref:Multidrug efflux pump Tap n=1 Tax=Bifidobacterium choloepi TaxID=2614131 RepID=A0A6I5N8I7_9BIFI|nr:MFS transporter [Bifidobacterium choloepi]NEG70141.1 MFS transporter [Bifidobacterium choloepi]
MTSIPEDAETVEPAGTPVSSTSPHSSNSTAASSAATVTTDVPSARPAGPATRPWRRRVALLLVGQALSLAGSSIVQYAVSWTLVMRTDSGAVVTATMLCSCLPQAVLSLFGGVWSDRWRRKTLIMLPDGLIAAATVVLALLLRAAGDAGNGNAGGPAALAAILVILAIRSAGAGVQTPAVQSFIPDVAPEDRLLRVNSINGTIQSANMLAAPAIAAVLVNVLPLWTILFVDVATAVIGIGFVALIRVPDRRTAHDSRGAGSVGTVFADLAAGVRYMWHHRVVRAVLLGYFAVCLLNTAPMNLTLVLVNRAFAGQTFQLGGWLSLTTSADKLAADELCWSVGMVLGGLVLSTFGSRNMPDTASAPPDGAGERRKRPAPRQLLVLAVVIAAMGVLTAGLGLAPTLGAYMAVDGLLGVATSFTAPPTFTLLQQQTPADMQGRVFGLLTTFSSFGTPLGLLVFGPLADIVPVRSVFVAGGLLTIPAGMLMLAAGAPSRRRVALPKRRP